MRATSAAAVAVPSFLLLLLLLTGLLLGGMTTRSAEGVRALRALADFVLAERSLHRDVLGARAGLLHNYDPLAREVDALDDALNRLRGTAEDTAAIDRLKSLATQEEALTEQFKTDNALLQNSLAYFGLLSTRLAQPDRETPVVAAITELAAAMLHLTLDTSPDTARAAEDALARLASLPASPNDARAMRTLLAHGWELHELLPATDTLLKTLFAIPSAQAEEAIRTTILEQRAASEARATRFRYLLYATSVLLLGCLVHFGLQLRARARALQRRAAFEHLIASISTRFITARPQEIGAYVEQALAQIAACIDADRAYFVRGGTTPRIHVWRQLGTTDSPGWPGHALTLAAQFAPDADGIIHVPSVARLPPGADKDDLAAADLHSWICVPRAGEDGISFILGFDSLQPRGILHFGEFGLLRMALDAIGNAVGRQALEQERARLEASLQQGRRLETVGALASGIAHNFNNIVGAILGYAEMAESQVEADSRAARNIDEIRRAGERARDLVDQILAFGRRRDARREPVRIDALMAETESLLQASWPTKGRFAIRSVPETAVVSGDAGQLQQVILNLCNNAMQAMDDRGCVRVESRVRTITQPRTLSHGVLMPGDYVCIAVSDTGRGMDEATLGRIFDPFFTTRAAGNGFGLATVREIMADLGGTMNVRSTPGSGSRFEAWLPCITTTEPVPEEATAALRLGRGETLLAVESERPRLLRDEEILAALGYEPVGFTQARDALAASQAAPNRFDAVVLGNIGPANAVLDFATTLHRTAPHLPILLATTSAGEIGADALAAAGISEIVGRPLTSAEIASALTRCLAR